MSRPHVLIVGAGGNVGSRLAHLLARSGLFRVSLGARDAQSVLALAEELRGVDPQGEFGFVALDCTRISAERLKEVGCWIVVDCTGAGGDGHASLVQAAISAHCHVIDLEDDRQHLESLSQFDAQARAKGIAVLSGAGTTPALTHAVSNSLAAGWRQIDSVDVALLTGNLSGPGPSRLAALSGRKRAPTQVYIEGNWQASPRRRVREARVEGLGRRRVAIADGADLDLLVARFRPRLRAQVSVEVNAGWSSLLLGQLGRLTAFPDLHRLGQKGGGMVVEVAGLDPRLEPKVARWTLVSQAGDEAYAPAIAAAAAIVALVKGLAKAGVHTAAGVVTLEGVRPWLAGLSLDIRTTGFKREVPLLARAMGAGFGELPESLRNLHRGRPAVLGKGEVAVMGAVSAGGRLLARLCGLPAEGSNVPFRLLVEAREGRESVTRWFGDVPIRTVRSLNERGLVQERAGALRFVLEPRAGPAGLEARAVEARIGPLRLPRLLMPRIVTRTKAEAEKLSVECSVSLPLLGRLFGYRGWLKL